MACGAMPFGPGTPAVRSLGGSETAALMAARELAKRGHEVLMFCNLPQQGQPDAFPHGGADDAGVHYFSIEALQSYATITAHDLYIAVRDPSLAAMHAH